MMTETEPGNVFSDVKFGDIDDLHRKLKTSPLICDQEDLLNYLSMANTKIKGVLIRECIPYTPACKNKMSIDNIANLYALSYVYLNSEEYNSDLSNKYTAYKAEADELLTDFLNNFRVVCHHGNVYTDLMSCGDHDCK